MDFKFSWRILDLVNPLYWLAFAWFLGRQARKRTYNGLFPGLFTIPLSLAFSVAAMITTKSFIGGDLGIGWYGWAPAAAFSGWFVGMFLWPFAYSIADILGDGLGHLTRALSENVLVPIANALRRLPLAGALWGTVDAAPEPGKRDRKWFTRFLEAATMVVGTLAAGYVGYLSTVWTKSFLSTSLVFDGWLGSTAAVLGSVFGNGWIIAGFVGFVVARLAWQPLYDVLDKGKTQGLTVLWSGVAGYHTAVIFGGSLLAQIGIGAAAFAVTAAWVFPALLLFFNEGLRRFGEFIKPVVEQIYDADKDDLRLWFHHTVNILVAGGVAYGAYTLGATLAWSLYLTIPLVAVAVLTSYLGVVHILKHNGGNAIIGFLTSLAVGFFAYGVYGEHLGWLGWLGGIIAGVFAAAIWGLALLPGIYALLKVTVGTFFTKAGEGLDNTHKAIFENVKGVYQMVFKKAQDATFNDKTEFKPLFGQVSNVLLAVAVLAAGIVYGLPHAGAGFTYWLALFGAVLASFVSYLVGGKLAKRDGGEPLIALLCIGAALWSGAEVFGVLTWAWYWSLAASTGIAIVVGYGLGLFIIPPIYAILKTIVNALPDKAAGGWKHGIANLLYWLHRGIYEVVDKFVLSPFKGLVDEVARFFAPIIYAISVRWRALMERIDRMFNRKRA